MHTKKIFSTVISKSSTRLIHSIQSLLQLAYGFYDYPFLAKRCAKVWPRDSRAPHLIQNFFLFSPRSSKMTTINILIEGHDCGSCKKLIRVRAKAEYLIHNPNWSQDWISRSTLILGRSYWVRGWKRCSAHSQANKISELSFVSHLEVDRAGRNLVHKETLIIFLNCLDDFHRAIDLALVLE